MRLTVSLMRAVIKSGCRFSRSRNQPSRKICTTVDLYRRSWHDARVTVYPGLKLSPDTLDLAASVESDRVYFAMGAQVDPVCGAEIAWIPGLSAHPAAVVVQRVLPSVAAEQGSAWIADLETRLRALHAPLARIYLDKADTPLDPLLLAAGYAPRAEIAFAGIAAAPAEVPGRRMVAITDAAGWARKRNFHEQVEENPDGHKTAAAQWVAMERAKCEAGSMRAFLCEDDGETVGAVNLFRSGHLMRLKNVVTHPASRRSGVGHAMVAHVSQQALVEGCRGMCVFALAGHAGEAMYRAAGLHPVGEQIEWSRSLV